MSDTDNSPINNSRNPRRTSGAVRKDHLENGAFLIEFKAPEEPRDMFGGRLMPMGAGRPAPHSGSERQSAIDRYRTMERKGFRVTKDSGCLIPDEQYGTYQQGATVKGHQRAFGFFAHWVPTQGAQAIRNEWGWPMTLQISHLCHRRSCCRIDHLVAEEQWRNIKRNYCGFSGVCDCGNTVPCLRRYQMQDQSDEPEYCTTKAEVEQALDGAPSFVLHGNERFAARDAKSQQRKQNKLKRKRKQDLHAHVTARKQAKLGSKQGQPGSQDSDFM